MRVIGYTRVSTAEQAEEGVSLDAQAARIRTYCEVHNLELITIESDRGFTGKRLKRPGLMRVLSALDAGQADGILVAKLDRLTRSLRDFVHLMEARFVPPATQSLLSACSQIDTKTAGGRMVLYIQISVSQWELETIGERTLSSIEHKRRRGERLGSLPYGWVVSPVTDDQGGKSKSLIEDPTEQKWIGRIKDLRNNRKLSLTAIADYLAREKVPTKSGNARWSDSAILNVLKRTQAPTGNPTHGA